MRKEQINKKGYVYILLSKDKEIYKIGSTDNIKIRMKALKRFWGDFDIDDCIAIECDREFKFRLESMLLTLMSEHKVSFDDEEKENGWSEFFYATSLTQLKSFIDNMLHKFIKDIKVINLKEIM